MISFHGFYPVFNLLDKGASKTYTHCTGQNAPQSHSFITTTQSMAANKNNVKPTTTSITTTRPNLTFPSSLLFSLKPCY